MMGAQTTEHDDALTRGERMAERMTDALGSWRFLIAQSLFLCCWLAWNTWTLFHLWQFDKPPYQGLNLLLSFQAAFTGPIVLIAGNVAARRDRRLWLEIRQLTSRNETMERHLEQIAAADHLEHGRLLRSLHAHVSCGCLTTVGDVRDVHEGGPDAPRH